MKTHTGTEIEVRCFVRKPNVFRNRLAAIHTQPMFPNVRGDVREYNLIYPPLVGAPGYRRIRYRIFSDGKETWMYTEKGENVDRQIKVLSETNRTLSVSEARRMCAMLESGGRTFAYERRFQAEAYRRYMMDGATIAIELFAFPYIGSMVEFELERGTKDDLRECMGIFGYSFKDHVKESAKQSAERLCMERGAPYSPALVFDAEAWLRFCHANSLRHYDPIVLSSKRQPNMRHVKP